MKKIAIEEIVDNFKNEVEMSNFIYVTPNEKDVDGFFFEDLTDDTTHNMVVREKVADKYYQNFKENYQDVVKLKNTKNDITLNFITKGTKVDNDFVSKIDKIYDGKSAWKVLDYILRNSYICYVEVRKVNQKYPAYYPYNSAFRKYRNIHA